MKSSTDRGPFTVEQMVDHVYDHFAGLAGELDEDEVRMRSRRAVATLIAEGLVSEWGFDAAGNLLFEPSARPVRAAYIVVRGR